MDEDEGKEKEVMEERKNKESNRRRNLLTYFQSQACLQIHVPGRSWEDTHMAHATHRQRQNMLRA